MRYRPASTCPGWNAAPAKLGDESSRPIGVVTVRLASGGGEPEPEAGAICVGIWDTELCMAPQPGQKREPSGTSIRHWGQVAILAS